MNMLGSHERVEIRLGRAFIGRRLPIAWFGRIRIRKRRPRSTHSADRALILTADIPSAWGASMLPLAVRSAARGEAAQVPRELEAREPQNPTDPSRPYPTLPYQPTHPS